MAFNFFTAKEFTPISPMCTVYAVYSQPRITPKPGKTPPVSAIRATCLRHI